jgi:hypothetical protein
MGIIADIIEKNGLQSGDKMLNQAGQRLAYGFVIGPRSVFFHYNDGSAMIRQDTPNGQEHVLALSRDEVFGIMGLFQPRA